MSADLSAAKSEQNVESPLLCGAGRVDRHDALASRGRRGDFLPHLLIP
jgi:hypothetical protein